MSTENQTAQPEVIKIQEAADGSAIIDLPPSIQSPTASAPAGEDDTDEGDERARQQEIASGGSVDPDAEALRDAKRQRRSRRKEYHRSVERDKDAKLQHLERQNRELLERMSHLDQRMRGSEVHRVDNDLEDAQNRIAFAKAKIREAAETGNGDLLVNAQEMLQDSTKQFEALAGLRDRMVKQPAPASTPKQARPDPAVQRMAADWLRNNSWYDPKGGDPDSKRALLQDQALHEEGYDPSTPEYWEELDDRLQKLIPHRYTDTTDEEPRRTSRPRNVVTASGRNTPSSTGGANQFTLSRDQVQAMKDAGMWDDPVKRAKMVKRYAVESRNNANRS